MKVDCRIAKLAQFKNQTNWFSVDSDWGIYDDKSKYNTKFVLQIFVPERKNCTEQILKEEEIKDYPKDSIGYCQNIYFGKAVYSYYPNFLNGRVFLNNTRTKI